MESDIMMRIMSYPKLTMGLKSLTNIALSSKDLVKPRWDGVPSGLILRFIPDPRSMCQLLNRLRDIPLGVLIYCASNNILNSKTANSKYRLSTKQHKQNSNGITNILQSISKIQILANSNLPSLNTRRAAPRLRINGRAKEHHKNQHAEGNVAKTVRPHHYFDSGVLA